MDTVDKAIADGLADIEGMLRSMLDKALREMERPPESKIEEALLAAILSLNLVAPVFDLGERRKSNSLLGKMLDARPWHINITAQAQVLTYRADFLLEVFEEGVKKGSIVVECDGHNFHERTKEQAKRDRSRDRQMTTAGYRVLRFTGSEIYQDSGNCVREIWNAARAVLGFPTP